ncbi:MAG: hypothetical protein F6K65_11025 [Moorea sp. SIO3C2]|nr:hypothetical protein [Moorena sp. SIO3C2]
MSAFSRELKAHAWPKATLGECEQLSAVGPWPRRARSEEVSPKSEVRRREKILCT